MKTQILALAAAALAMSAPAYAGSAAKQTVAEKGEAKLAKLLEGRVAGKPVGCISTFNSSNLQVIDETAVVYKTGRTVWVARPTDPRQLQRDDVLVTKRTNGSQLCTNDSMHTVDRSGGFTTGVVFLEDFVPYTKEG